MELGLVHLYWGEGKGKTTAAMGLALRALGNGCRVVIVQFLKGADTGEVPLLRQLGAEIYRGKAGQKFVFQMDEAEKAAARAVQNANLAAALARPADLLILDEWLIRPLSPQESYDMLEIVEARCQKSMIFCTQYQSEGWYTRIDPNPESDSPVSEAIMDRIIHNAYEVLVDGRVSMRERKGLKAAREGGGQDT